MWANYRWHSPSTFVWSLQWFIANNRKWNQIKRCRRTPLFNFPKSFVGNQLTNKLLAVSFISVVQRRFCILELTSSQFILLYGGNNRIRKDKVSIFRMNCSSFQLMRRLNYWENTNYELTRHKALVRCKLYPSIKSDRLSHKVKW